VKHSEAKRGKTNKRDNHTSKLNNAVHANVFAYQYVAIGMLCAGLTDYRSRTAIIKLFNSVFIYDRFVLAELKQELEFRQPMLFYDAQVKM